MRRKKGETQTSRLAPLSIPSGVFTNLFMTPRKLVSTDSRNERRLAMHRLCGLASGLYPKAEANAGKAAAPSNPDHINNDKSIPIRATSPRAAGAVQLQLPVSGWSGMSRQV
jgi:hypothetical protein